VQILVVVVVVSFTRLGSRSHIKIQCRVSALPFEWDLGKWHSCVFDATVVQLETPDVSLRHE
jgi:hypothetical protein